MLSIIQCTELKYVCDCRAEVRNYAQNSLHYSILKFDCIRCPNFHMYIILIIILKSFFKNPSLFVFPICDCSKYMTALLE